MMKTIVPTLLICILSQWGFTQTFDKAKLDHYFNKLEEHQKFMGSVAVSQNGKLIYSKSIGFADVEKKIKANEHTRYRIGSVSKTFTAVLVMKAVESKKLKLTRTIETYFLSIPNAPAITIEHLLRHRSGIHNFTNDMDYSMWYTQPKTEEEMIDIIAKKGSDFEPGTYAQYSNSNFVLLTYILEKTFQKPFREIIEEYIVKPAGLSDTYFGNKTEAKPDEAKSYIFIEDWLPQADTDLSIPQGAGGIISTPSDLVKFSDALFSGKLLSKETVSFMKSTQDHYGIGMIEIPFYEKTGYGHTGGIDGFSAVFCHFDDGDISYAMTSNGSNFNDNDISIAVMSAVFGKEYEIPEFKIFEVSTEALEQYTGVYASSQFPLKLTITRNDNILTGQATGQPSFPLEAIEKDKFQFMAAGLILEFNPAEKTMILKQGGGEYTFSKE
jgi:CubicO group peptidase (beta-lactamase class C family)